MTSSPSVRSQLLNAADSLRFAASCRIDSIADRGHAAARPRLSSSSRFATSVLSTDRPVTLPPGRARLATRPAPTGSSTPAKTIGTSMSPAWPQRQPASAPSATMTSALALHEFGCHLGSAIESTLGPAILDCDRSRPSIPAEFHAVRCGTLRRPLSHRRRRAVLRIADHRHASRLLRARRERPHAAATAEQRDELAPLVAVGTCISWHAPRPDPYVRLSRIRLLPRVCDGTSCRIRSSACDTRAWF